MSEKVSSSSTSSVSGLQGRETLRGYFQTGETPTQSNFTDLIDSMVNQQDDQVTIDDTAKTISLGSNTSTVGKTPWKTVVESTANPLSFTSAETPQVDPTQLALVLQKSKNPDQVGIGLGWQSAATANAGAAVVYEGINTDSVGKLHFAVQAKPDSNNTIPIQMTITDQGRVGIGTTNPTTTLQIKHSSLYYNPGGLALEANDGKSAYNLINGNGNLWIGYNSTAGFPESGYSTPFYISSAGQVGIGTTSPGSLLDVAGDANVSSTLTIGGTSLDDTAINATNNSDNDATLSVENSGSNDAIYATCGQGHGLHAINNSTSHSTLYSENQGDNVAIYATNTSSSSPTLLVENSTTSGPAAAFTGNVGLGTSSPQNALDINGGMVIGNSYAGNNGAPSNGLAVEGSVGIGTTSPQTTLDVNGNVNVSEDLTVESTLGIATPATGKKLTIGNSSTYIDLENNNLIFSDEFAGTLQLSDLIISKNLTQLATKIQSIFAQAGQIAPYNTFMQSESPVLKISVDSGVVFILLNSKGSEITMPLQTYYNTQVNVNVLKITTGLTFEEFSTEQFTGGNPSEVYSISGINQFGIYIVNITISSNTLDEGDMWLNSQT